MTKHTTPLSRVLSLLSTIVPIVLVPTAGFALYNQIRAIPPKSINQALHLTPPTTIVIAILMVAFAYMIIASYDGLILHHLKHPLPFGWAAFASFTAASISTTIGFSILSSGPIRLRIYSRLKLTHAEIGAVIGYGSIMYFSGFIALAGILFTFFPADLPGVFKISAPTLRYFGIGCLMLIGTCIALSVARHTFGIAGRKITIPEPKLLMTQLLVAATDWSMPPLIFFALLPVHQGINPLLLIEIMLLAQFLGIISNVPGGLGIFDSVALALIGPLTGPDDVTAALILYRTFYNLLPFTLGILALFLFETRLGKKYFPENTASGS